jgi:TP901 family phage tail tape measure protein
MSAPEKVTLMVEAPKQQLHGVEHAIERIDVLLARLLKAQDAHRRLMRAGVGGSTVTTSSSGAKPAGPRGGTINVPASAFAARINGGKIIVRLTPRDFVVAMPTGGARIQVPSVAPRAASSPLTPATPIHPPNAGHGLVSTSRNVVDNLKHVALWGGTTGALFGGLAVARGAVESSIRLEHQTARLTQVFQGNRAEALHLADATQRLASATGRSTDEAMESAIQWARLGLNRIQVTEAVRVSLVAANVAEISAADATEHLTSLTRVYHLRVQELAGVLGMLNSISNTYNVTNAQMLEGLTRTSAIAKQAGVPLAELIGIIGAGVGGTGQTGANIGNSLKTIIGRVQSPEIADALRNQFRFEVTVEGGEDIKSFSTLLAELFVKYQELNRAEKQSLLFQTAGKFHASRLAALLDGYVRSQVLAIQAQLNLNSAEEENAKILATLKAQLTGLVAEWERFASTQAGHGPSKALREITVALKNILVVMNLPGVSAAVTGIGALLAVTAAKALLVSVTMQKAGAASGVMANSVAAVKSALLSLNATMAVTAHRYTMVAGRSAAVVAGLHNIAGGAFVAARAAQATSRGLYAAFLGIGVFARSLSVAIVALSEFLLPLLAIGATIWIFNRGMAELGLNNDKANKATERFTRQTESAKNAAEAAARAVRLYGTALAAMETPRDPEKRGRILGEVAEAASFTEGGDAGVKQLQAEFAAMNKVNDLAGIRARLEELSGKAAAFRAVKAQEAFTAMRDEDEMLAKRQNELERGKFVVGNRKTMIEEVRGRRAELADKRTGLIVEEFEARDNEYERFLAADEKHTAYMERQKTLAEAISDVWKAIPTANRTDALNVEVSRLAMVEAFHRSNLELLEKQREAASSRGESSTLHLTDEAKRKRTLADDLARSAIEREHGFTRAELEADAKMFEILRSPLLVASRASYFGQGIETGPYHGLSQAFGLKSPFNDRGELDPALFEDPIAKANVARARRLATDALALDERANQPGVTAGANRIEGAINFEREAVEKAKREREAQETARSFRQYEDRANVSFTVARAQSESFATGGNVGEQLTNQNRGLEMSIRRHDAMAKTSEAMGFQVGVQNALNAALAQSVQLEQNRTKIVEAYYDLQKRMHEEMRAFQRTLLGAGPGELLRKLAVGSLASRGRIGSGGFFALDAGARQDLLDRPEFSDTARSLRSLRGGNPDLFNRDGTPSEMALQALMARETTRREGFMGRLAGAIPEAPQAGDQIAVTAREAAAAVGSLAAASNVATTAMVSATNSLHRMTEAAGEFIARMGGGHEGPPRMAQAAFN